MKANIVQAAGISIPGYGDEAVRLPKAYGQGFDGIVFRDSNLVVEVSVEINFSPSQQPTVEAWRRTQEAARIVTRYLNGFRR